MDARALVIAVEDYPGLGSSNKLAGTIANAVQFAKVIETLLSVPRKNIIFCSSNGCEYRTHGTRRSEIEQAILKLLDDGLNTTNCLFVFLSGHGIMKPADGSDPHTDVLLCSDFKSSRESGNACIRVDELTTLLARGLLVANQ